MEKTTECDNRMEPKDNQSFVTIPLIRGESLLLFVILLLFLWLDTSIVSSPIQAWFIGIILLCLCIRRMHPWDPLKMLFLGWGFVFINVFSGLFQFVIHGSLFLPLCLIILYLFLFVAGYIWGSPKVKIDLDSIRERLDKIYENSDFIRIGNISAYCSILSFLFLCIDLFFLRRLNPMDLNAVREDVLSMESAGVLAILSSFLSAGGFFCGICLFFVSGKKQLFFWGLVCFAAESFLSAGRQMLFMFAILCLFCFLSKKAFSVSIIISKHLKYLFLIFCAIVFSYLAFLTQTRDLINTSYNSMSTRFAIDNNLTYSQEYQHFLDNTPQQYGDLATNGIVYFATQIPAFCERFNMESFPLLQGHFLQAFLPFVNRQVDKLFPPDYSKQYRFSQEYLREGFISTSSWKTFFYSGLHSLGHLGLPIFMFLYGMVSKKIFVYVLQNISFPNINLAFINIVLPLYTQMYWGWGEQYFLFYSIVVLFLCLREQRSKKKDSSCLSHA